MKKYAYCFGCDGKFGASDGIASARRSSYFDLIDDPDVSSEDLLAIKHFYTWNRKPLTTPLCWDWSTALDLTSCALTSYPLQKLTPGYTGKSTLGDGFRTVTVRKSSDPDLTWCLLKN